MASNQSKLKHSLPLLLALVVLISCLPVIPATAADTLSLSGYYTVGSWSDSVGAFSISCDGYVVVDGEQVQFKSIFIDERDNRDLWFTLLDGSEEYFFSYEGQSSTDDHCLYLSSVTIYDSNAISFFSNYVTVKTFPASIIIDGAHNTLPCDSSYYYQMDVTSTGARFYNDFGSLTYTYNGVGEFLGFSRGGDSVVYSVGMSGVTMQGSLVELGAVSSFTTFITIDGTTYPFSSLTEKPSVTMAVTYSGATLSYGDQSYTYTYSGSGEFLGFSATGEAPAYYTPGNTYTLSAGPYSISSVFEVLSFKSTVLIGDQTYTFTGTDVSPEVYLVVNETGAVMSSGGSVYTYTYSGEGTFQGLSRVSDGSTITYPVGSSDYIHGTNTLYPISGDVYTSTITIDDKSFVFSSLTEQPAITLNVTDTGVTLVFNGEAHVYIYSGEDTFQGLSYSATGSASLVPGESYSLAAGDHTLYAIASTSGELILSAGQWEANKSLASASNEYVDLSAWPDGLTSVPLSFISSGQTFSSMSYQGTIQYGNCLFYGDTRVYGFDTLVAISDPGWKMDAYALVYLATEQSVPEAFYTWFTSNFSYVGSDLVDPVYKTTVNIYDPSGLVLYKTFVFSGDVAPAPKLVVQVDGCTISCQDQTYSWSPVSGAFYGFSLTQNGSAVFEPEQTYTLPGGSLSDIVVNLYLAARSPDGFVTVVVIGDQVFEFSDSEKYPTVSIVMGTSGCGLYLVDSSSMPVNWTADPPWRQTFLGFAVSPNSSLVTYPAWDGEQIPQPFRFQGSAAQNVLFLYPVYSGSSGSDTSGSGDSGSEDPAGVRQILSGFVDFLITPVMSFFNVEFIPGFSFGKVALVAFIFGLMFWLLRVSR